jgi:hypothetical protein
MSKAELKGDLARANLIRDLALAQEVRDRLYAAIVRFVRRLEAGGPAKDMMEQIGRDKTPCKMLVDYEEKSEIIGMMQFVHDLKMKPPRRRPTVKNRTTHSVPNHDVCDDSCPHADGNQSVTRKIYGSIRYSP